MVEDCRIKRKTFDFGNWQFKTVEGPIVSEKSEKMKNIEEVVNLPAYPEMLYNENCLIIKNIKTGLCINFNTIDALKTVSKEKINIKVQAASAWKHNLPTPYEYDWTFSTKYNGSFDNQIKVAESGEKKIDYELLKKKEEILFFEQIFLLEDELNDFGSSSLVLKIRVMPSCFFILARSFTRVDGVIAKFYDARLFGKPNEDSLILENTNGLMKFSNDIPYFYSDPDICASKMETSEKLNKFVNFV